MFKFQSLVVLSLVASQAYGHAFINAVQGGNGLTAVGFGVDNTGSIPRNGTKEQPFQLDTPVLKNLADDPCGATLLGGSIDIAKSLAAQEKVNNGDLPSVPSNGTITLGIHQVNADGGGPFTAAVNADGTGKDWVNADVVSQPPGINGLLHNGPADSTLQVQMPDSVSCSGGSSGNACLVRITNGGQNSASIANGAGPFGGCVAVSQTNNAAATGNNNNGNNNGKNNNNNGNNNGNNKNAANGNGNGQNNNNAANGNGQNNNAANGKGQNSNAANGNGQNKNNNKANGGGFGGFKRDGRTLTSRFFYPSLAARKAALHELTAEVKRQLNLDAQTIDELETSLGTAIDIPIDRIAGHDDDGKLGGNSTQPNNAALTTQQAIDLKKAVQNGIAQALNIMANSAVDAGNNGQDSSITDKANADADAALADGEATSINAGNAGVGFFNTANVDSLLGEIATATADLPNVTGTAASAATTTASSNSNNKNNKGNNKGNNKNNGGGNNNNANNNANNANNGNGGNGGNNKGGGSGFGGGFGGFARSNKRDANRVRSWF